MCMSRIYPYLPGKGYEEAEAISRWFRPRSGVHPGQSIYI